MQLCVTGTVLLIANGDFLLPWLVRADASGVGESEFSAHCGCEAPRAMVMSFLLLQGFLAVLPSFSFAPERRFQ